MYRIHTQFNYNSLTLLTYQLYLFHKLKNYWKSTPLLSHWTQSFFCFFLCQNTLFHLTNASTTKFYFFPSTTKCIFHWKFNSICCFASTETISILYIHCNYFFTTIKISFSFFYFHIMCTRPSIQYTQIDLIFRLVNL